MVNNKNNESEDAVVDLDGEEEVKDEDKDQAIGKNENAEADTSDKSVEVDYDDILEPSDIERLENEKSDSTNDSSAIADTSGNDKSDDVITVDDTADPDIQAKTVTDAEFFSAVSDEEKKYYEETGLDPDSVEDMSIQCTACWKQVNHHIRNNIMRHPVLGVPICRSCKYFYEDDGEWEKDEQGSDCYCRWCANGGEMVCCDTCSNAYCKRCIQRNLGRKKFAEINDCDEWKCFLCNPEPIFSQRKLMFAISKWYLDRKSKKKLKDKEAKQKEQKKVQEEKQKQSAAEQKKIENFIDENIHEAFDTLRIYQKCLEDERKKWIKNKKTMTPESAASMVTKLRKIYSITKQNMDLLDTALVQSYRDKFPDEADDRLKPVKAIHASPKCKILTKSPVVKGPGKLNGANSTKVNKRKMKDTSLSAAKKLKVDDVECGDDEIAVEEIVLNGEKVLSDAEFFDPSQLCSIQITGDTQPPAPPKIPPVKRVSGPLRISSKMFKKKSPMKPSARPATPDSDIEEIVIEDDDKKEENGGDSDVSLDF